MNKSLLFLIIILNSVFIVGIVSSSDIGYVVRDSSSLNSGIINGITEAGYDYEIIENSEIPQTNFV